MHKEELIDAIVESIFDFSLAINEEFGGYYKDIPEKYRVVLILLTRYETLYVKDVARLLHLSSSSASQLLSRMEAEHYVARELNPNKRTNTFVKLGEKGRETAQKMEETWNDISSRYLMKLSTEDLEAFQDISIKLKDIVERKKGSAE